MVRDGGALHPTDFHLHYVLQKAAPNKIVVLALKRAVIALESDYLVVEIVYVVKDIVTQRRCCSCFQFEDNRVSLFVSASRVNLRTKEHLACFHIPEVIFLLQESQFF